MVNVLQNYDAIVYWTGSIELREMTEIIGTLYQMEGVAKVGQQSIILKII